MIWLLGGVAFGCNCAEGRLSPAEAYARADEVVLAERVSDEEGLVTFVVKESFVRRGLKAGETFRMAYSTDLACGVSFSTVGQILLYLTEKDHVYDACDLQSAVRHGNTYWWNGSSLF